MPRPTRTRRIRGAPSSEVPRPSTTTTAPPRDPSVEAPGTFSAAVSDIYSATPPAEEVPSTDKHKGKGRKVTEKDAPSERKTRSSRRITAGGDVDEGLFNIDSDLDMDDPQDEEEDGATASKNTSVISVGQFKRRGRSRLPSFTGNEPKPIRPGSRDGASTIESTFNLALFQKRVRKPSVIGANRRKRARSVATTNSDVGTDVEKRDGAVESDEELSDLENFLPDDLSTPAHGKRKSGGARTKDVVTPASVNPRKRKSLEGQGTDRVEKVAKLKGNAKSRDTQETADDEVEVPASVPPPASDGEAGTVEVPASVPIPDDAEVPDGNDVTMRDLTMRDSTQIPASGPVQDTPMASIEIDDDGLSDLSSSDIDEMHSPLITRRIPARHQTPPVRNDEDHAPPMSGTSSSGSPVAWPSIHNMARRRRPVAPTTPIKGHVTAAPVDGGSSPLSSPPSLTHSPNFTKASRGKKPAKVIPPKVMTADLQSLLPQRRARAHDKDMHDVDQDEDELASSRPARKRGTSRPRSRAGASKEVTTLAQRKKMQFEPNRRTSRTYGSRHKDHAGEASTDVPDDAEPQAAADVSMFEPLAEDTFSQESKLPEGIQKSVELKEAKKKFKEVDKWEMEFEEVDDGMVESQDAR